MNITWIKIWDYLDRNNGCDSAMQIHKNIDAGVTTIYRGLDDLERLGLINIRRFEGRNLKISFTQSFYDNRVFMRNLYDTLVTGNKERDGRA